MAPSDEIETITATSGAAGDSQSSVITVVVRGRSVDSGAVRTTGWLILLTVFGLGILEMVLQIDLDGYGRPIEGDPNFIAYQQWRNVAVYVQLASILLPALIAFFGFHRARSEMRDAIAGSFLVFFIVILSQSVLLNLGVSENQEGTLREVLVTNFMALVGTIGLFYFSSEAVIRSATHYSATRIGVAKALATPATKTSAIADADASAGISVARDHVHRA
jgi:hypothetical protein